MTLTDLVRLYAAIARGGSPVDLRESLSDCGADDALGIPREASSVRRNPPVLDGRAAWSVASVLAGTPMPAHAPAGTIAFKTGTSYGYRDAWAIGFDGRHVVGVWTGRPDGAPVPGLIGIDAAAPILIDVFARLGVPLPLPPPPPGILTAASAADLPPPLQRVSDRRAAGSPTASEDAPEIAYPPQGARVDLGLAAGQATPLVLKVRGGTPPYTWFANGSPIGREPFARTARWSPDGPGYVTLTVVDGRGLAARATARLE